MRKLYITLLVSLFLTLGVAGQKISISLFNSLKLSTVLITPTNGSYKLILGDSTVELKVNQILYISRTGDSLIVRDANQNLGTWKRVTVVGQTGEDIIRVKPIVPASPARLYDDNLSFYVDLDRIFAINLIDQEKYVAAVVEAEGGLNRQPEFYKVQALIVRTYTFAHLKKHLPEGFNLCDEVHCQAYMGRSEKNGEILDAVLDTKDLVIVDAERNPITAAFHANCGGQTANSEDVWVKPLPYLVSVPDRYCLGSNSSTWERSIPIGEWKKFLSQNGVDTLKIHKNSDLDFQAKTRPKYYAAMGVEIPTTDIRKHFRLRSAWFSVSAGKNEVRLSGRGYGHGVGLCQDGAINMAQKGWTYDQIVQFYYKGVSIVKLTELDMDRIKVDTTLNNLVEPNLPPPGMEFPQRPPDRGAR